LDSHQRRPQMLLLCRAVQKVFLVFQQTWVESLKK